MGTVMQADERMFQRLRLSNSALQVKKEYQELHTKYTPLWDKEEVERRQRWSDFLHSFVGSEAEESKYALLYSQGSLNIELCPYTGPS